MKYVPAYGPDTAQLVIVGEAPGGAEEAEGRPFVGWAGQLLNDSLMRCGIAPDNVYFTNVSKFRPPNNDIKKFVKAFGKKKMMPNDHVVEHIVELYKEIATVKPTVVTPVGNLALWAMTGKMQIGRRRGSVMEFHLPMRLLEIVHEKAPARLGEFVEYSEVLQGQKIIPTYHPSGVNRMMHLRPLFEADLRRICRDLTFRELRLPERTHHLNPDTPLLEDLVERLFWAPCFSADIECVRQELYCVGFSCDPSWSLVLTVDDSYRLEQIVKLLTLSPARKRFQNGMFDVSFLRRKAGIAVKAANPKWAYDYDTMIAHHSAYQEFRSGLDLQTSIYTREPYYKAEGKDWSPKVAADVVRFMTYNGKDCCVTEEIAQVQEQRVLNDTLIKKSFEATMAQTPVIVDIMARGVRIDERARNEHWEQSFKKRKELQSEFDTQILDRCIKVAENPKAPPEQRNKAMQLAQKVAKAMAAESPKGGLNVSSAKDFACFVYDVCGYRLYKKPNERSTKEEIIKLLFGQTGDKVLLTAISIRKERKLQSSYLSLKCEPEEEGYSRTWFSINPVGTKTTRWAVRKTIEDYGNNGQTWPTKIRNMMVPEKGMVFLYVDLSQVEDRIVSYYANIRKKIWAFENEVDAHSLTASLIFGLTIEEVQALHKQAEDEGRVAPERYLGKQSNHAFNYGEGPERFWKSVNKKADETGIRITIEQAKQIRNAHLRAYPEIKHYWNLIEAQVKKSRCLVNPFGRKRRFGGRLDNETFRDAYSWIPQSTAPDIVNRAMVRVYHELDGAFVTMQVHDALLVQVPANDYEAYARKIVEFMAIPVPINGREIVVPADAKVGDNWRDMKKIKNL